MIKQVDKSHYRFDKYMSVSRWGSLWHQLDEIKKLSPQSALEIGPGPGYFQALAQLLGIRVETVDLDPDLKPDHVASATDLPLPDNSYDVACAFQMLEHLPFDAALIALDELARVARNHVLISLPDARRSWRYLFHLPRLGEQRVLVNRPQLQVPVHRFDGEHYWEINKRGYELNKIVGAFTESGRLRLERTFRSFENPYHRFFVFSITAPPSRASS